MTRNPLSTFPAAFLLLGSALSAQHERSDTRPSPLLPVESFGEKGLLLEVDYALLEGTDELERLELFGVLVPTATGFDSVDLALRRVDSVADHAQLWIDGQLAGGADALRAGVTCWSGTVVGEAGTDVVLSVTPTGVYGWVWRAGTFAHWSPAPIDGEDWSTGRSLVLHDSDPLMVTSFDELFVGRALGEPRNDLPKTPGMPQSHAGTTLECFIAVETDARFYSWFNNPVAELNYIVALWAAVSDRFESQTNTKISLPYVGIYTQGIDPWTSDGTILGPNQLLGAFAAAWANNLPMNANLGHFMTGMPFSGRYIANLDVLCDGTMGFSASLDLRANTPLPVVGSSPFNRDFNAVAAATGINFGSRHTSDYCPPLDECFVGACSSGNGCGPGMLLSRCYLCPGGNANIEPNFHPTMAANLAQLAANSCLGPCQSCTGTLDADFTADVTSGPTPLSVNFTDLSSGGTVTSHSWSFGDGTTSSTSNPTHVYVDPGEYLVSLVVSGPGGLDVEHRAAFVTASDPTTIDSITPSNVPSLIPGSEETIVVTGLSFLPATTMEIDSSPLATSFTVVNLSTIRFDMPLLSLGTHVLAVSNANGTDSISFDVVPPAEPVLMLGDGDGAHDIFSTTGMDVTAAGQPFGLQLVIASPSNLPSTLPGKFDLLIGNFFTQDYNLGPLFLDVNGIGTTNIPMVGIVNLTIYVQTLQVNLPTPAGFPWPDSNVAEGFIWF